jgi:hypothetical protein
MNPIISAGVLIGVLCSACTFVVGFTGLYKDPAAARSIYVPVVILLEIGGLVWGLRRTAGQGRAYTAQILAGAMMAIVAGVIIVASSLLFTTVVFPDYFAEIETTRAAQTPMGEAMAGFMGTLITGIIASAIIAIFVRSRPDRIRARPHLPS